jgi:type II secretory pathway pseudopilin PulG
MARLARSRGFSLVELLVAAVFTMILMAGLAVVFRSSLSASYTMGEKISSVRRNRVSMDLLYDDLNRAGMVMVDITSPLAFGTNPPFYIVPNVPIGSTVAGAPERTDILYFAFDQPLPFEGKLKSGGGASSLGATAPTAVMTGATLAAGTDNKYEIECFDAAYAAQVSTGMYMQIKDDLSHAALQIQQVDGRTGTRVTVETVTTASVATQVTGRGDPGTLRSNQRIYDSGVVFLQPARQVRYRIAMMNLDPTTADATPCLVREMVAFDASADPSSAGFFTPPLSTTVIAENVSAFKVYLSANAGAAWAGLGLGTATTGFTNGWTNGIQATLNSQLADIGRSGYTTTLGDTSWYRNNPLLVRLDITTRTAAQRGEYSSTGTTAAYKNLTQTTVLIPRHFGLPLS